MIDWLKSIFFMLVYGERSYPETIGNGLIDYDALVDRHIKERLADIERCDNARTIEQARARLGHDFGCNQPTGRKE